MRGTFHLTITLGNDAMQTTEDLGEAVGNVAELIQGGNTEGIVRDGNGNTVGRFAFEES